MGSPRSARTIGSSDSSRSRNRWNRLPTGSTPGIAVWDRAVLDAIPSGRPVSFEREIVPGVLERGVFGYLDRGFWEDAGSPERLLRAQRLLFDAGRAAPSEPPPGADRVNRVAYGRRTRVAARRSDRT